MVMGCWEGSVPPPQEKKLSKGLRVRVSAGYRPSSKVVGCGGGVLALGPTSKLFFSVDMFFGCFIMCILFNVHTVFVLC